jgi:hypothetical protein
MSKVQLQGNVSGTGVFTIASPNSNTDRTLTLPDNTGTVLTTASSLAGLTGVGKVLQVVQTTTSTGVTTTSTTVFSDTTLTASITPSSSSSRILVLVMQEVQVFNGGGPYATGLWRLLRGATAIYAPSSNENGNIFAYDYGGSGINIYRPTPMIWLDSPSTTSSTTYKTQIRMGTNGGQQVNANVNSPASMTLLEIAV